MLNLFGAIALVISGMIGGGVLVLPSKMCEFGAWSIFGWMLSATIVYFLAIVFIRLGLLFKSGSPIDYIADTFGDDVGYLIGSGYFMAMSASGACIAATVGYYLAAFLNIESVGFYSNAGIALIAILSIFLLNIINFGIVNNFMVVLAIAKVSIFLLIGFFGLPHIGSYAFVFGPIPDLFQSSSMAFFAFFGIEFAAMSNALVRNAEKNVPLATKIGLFFSFIVFLLVHLAVLFVLPNPASSSKPVFEVAVILFGNVGANIACFIAILSCLATLNGIMLVEASIMNTFSKKSWVNKSMGEQNDQGFAWFGAVIWICLVSAILLNQRLMYLSLLIANSMVGVLYLFSCLVDIKCFGLDKYNLLALIGSVLLQYNINLTILSFMFIVYSGSYMLKVAFSIEEKRVK